MEYTVNAPAVDRMDELVALCAAHAAFEQSAYDPSGKQERLTSVIFCDNPNVYCRVVEVDDKYVGYIIWMRQYSTWNANEYLYMDCLFLDDAYRGLGIGVALVEEMKTYASDHEITQVEWQTPDFNKRAIKFYRRIGATSLSKERFFLTI